MNQVPLSDLRVLVIDDDRQILSQAESILNNLGISHVHLVSHADDGLEAFDNDYLDIVFLDLCLDEHSGVDLIMRLGKAQPAVKCVIMSAAAEKILESIELLAKKCGVQVLGRIRKPLTPEQFEDILEKLGK